MASTLTGHTGADLANKDSAWWQKTADYLNDFMRLTPGFALLEDLGISAYKALEEYRMNSDIKDFISSDMSTDEFFKSRGMGPEEQDAFIKGFNEKKVTVLPPEMYDAIYEANKRFKNDEGVSQEDLNTYIKGLQDGSLSITDDPSGIYDWTIQNKWEDIKAQYPGIKTINDYRNMQAAANNAAVVGSLAGVNNPFYLSGVSDSGQEGNTADTLNVHGVQTDMNAPGAIYDAQTGLTYNANTTFMGSYVDPFGHGPGTTPLTTKEQDRLNLINTFNSVTPVEPTKPTNLGLTTFTPAPAGAWGQAPWASGKTIDGQTFYSYGDYQNYVAGIQERAAEDERLHQAALLNDKPAVMDAINKSIINSDTFPIISELTKYLQAGLPVVHMATGNGPAGPAGQRMSSFTGMSPDQMKEAIYNAVKNDPGAMDQIKQYAVGFKSVIDNLQNSQTSGSGWNLLSLMENRGLSYDKLMEMFVNANGNTKDFMAQIGPQLAASQEELNSILESEGSAWQPGWGQWDVGESGFVDPYYNMANWVPSTLTGVEFQPKGTVTIGDLEVVGHNQGGILGFASRGAVESDLYGGLGRGLYASDTLENQGLYAPRTQKEGKGVTDKLPKVKKSKSSTKKSSPVTPETIEAYIASLNRGEDPRKSYSGYSPNSYFALSEDTPSFSNGGEVPLEDGAFIIPADVVSHLGNGSTKGGADLLDSALFGHSAGGYLLNGEGDGMSDSIPAIIHGEEPLPAAVADGEYVVPAPAVAQLGQGSVKRGANKLYDMMDRVRKVRTGTTKQAPQTDMKKFIPR
jgi:hypothetical protein